jgi:hypothetical protein
VLVHSHSSEVGTQAALGALIGPTAGPREVDEWQLPLQKSFLATSPILAIISVLIVEERNEHYPTPLY